MEAAVISRVVISSAVVVALAGTAVHTQSQSGVVRLGDSPEQQLTVLTKQLVTGFEQVLSSAVVQGGRVVQAQVRNYIPDLSLQLAGEPIVSGFPVEGLGFVFDVQCPNILESPLMMLDYYRNKPELISVAARGTLPSDFHAGRAYGDAVREAMMDAMVDFSSPLPLDDGEWLVVVARVPSDGTSRQDLEDKRKLILQISGADLRSFNERTLSRDEAKQRIRETRF
jgi:hypothetical protein